MAIEYSDDIKKMIADQAKRFDATPGAINLNNSVNASVQQTPALQAPAAYDPTSEINKMKEYQRQQAIAGLTKARDSQLSNLNTEKATIAPQYYNKRNETATGSQLQAKNFAEYMANRGQTNSGTSAQAEISRNVGLQGAIGNLNVGEANAFADIARRTTDTNNAYESDVASANAGIEASAMQQLIAAQQRAYENNLNQYNTDRNYNFQQQQFDYNKLDNAQKFDYQKAQDAINNTYRQGTFEWQKAQADLENEFRNKQFDYSVQQDALNRQMQMQQLAAKSSGSGSSGSSSKVSASKQPYENDNQKNIYDFYNDNKVSYGEKLDTLAQVSQDKGYSQEDRDYADRMKQALRATQYYDAAYANYRGNY